MVTRLVPVVTVTAALLLAATAQAQTTRFSAPRTPWGDPDLQGSYTNKDENGTPFEQPADLAGKKMSEFGEKAMAALRKQRQARAQAGAGRIGGSEEEDTGAGPSHWYEQLDANNAQPRGSYPNPPTARCRPSPPRRDSAPLRVRRRARAVVPPTRGPTAVSTIAASPVVFRGR
jgi:hypothetical protein